MFLSVSHSFCLPLSFFQDSVPPPFLFSLYPISDTVPVIFSSFLSFFTSLPFYLLPYQHSSLLPSLLPCFFSPLILFPISLSLLPPSINPYLALYFHFPVPPSFHIPMLLPTFFSFYHSPLLLPFFLLVSCALTRSLSSTLASLPPSLLQEMTGWNRLLLIQSVLPGVCTSRLTGGVSRRTQTLSALTHRGGEAGRQSEGTV